jgi:glyoxylase-like metal-dependent hydrolase (beta-lactamase superfamily II)
MKIRVLSVGPFGTNCFLVACGKTNEAILIDPGDDADRIAEAVRRTSVTLKALYATHGHIDHVGAAADLKRTFGVPFYIHPGDRILLDQLGIQAAMFGLTPPTRPEPDGDLEAGGRFRVGEIAFEVLFVPGHSPGHVAFHVPEEKAVFDGDVLFAGGIGRTDLPGGDSRQLLASIRGTLFPLGDDVTCYPGHGPETTIGEERAGNPFVGGM